MGVRLWGWNNVQGIREVTNDATSIVPTGCAPRLVCWGHHSGSSQAKNHGVRREVHITDSMVVINDALRKNPPGVYASGPLLNGLQEKGVTTAFNSTVKPRTCAT